MTVTKVNTDNLQASAQEPASFSTLPSDCLFPIFSHAIGYGVPLETLSLVCRRWQHLGLDKNLLEPFFQQFVDNLTYDIDHSSVENYKEKIILIKKTQLEDFVKTIKECIETAPELENELTILGAKRFLIEYDITDLIKKLISKNKPESVSILFLFRPKFDVNAITEELFEKIKEISKQSHELHNEFNFCIQLMLKLKYHACDIYKKYIKDDIDMVSLMTKPIISNVNGLKITDYMENGHFFTPPTIKSSVRALIYITSEIWFKFYVNNKFKIPFNLNFSDPLTQISFGDKKLQGHIRKTDLSEDDLKEFILDLLTKVGFNFDEINPATGLIKKDTLLSQFRQSLGIFPLPQPNAITKALEEYDRLQAKKV